MSIVSEQKYRITNVRFELALHLSEDDGKFIVGEPVADSPRQWVRAYVSLNSACRCTNKHFSGSQYSYLTAG
jgi:hypothetical protein